MLFLQDIRLFGFKVFGNLFTLVLLFLFFSSAFSFGSGMFMGCIVLFGYFLQKFIKLFFCLFDFRRIRIVEGQELLASERDVSIFNAVFKTPVFHQRHLIRFLRKIDFYGTVFWLFSCKDYTFPRVYLTGIVQPCKTVPLSGGFHYKFIPGRQQSELVRQIFLCKLPIGTSDIKVVVF